MNLQTRYLGLALRNPLVASAGPLTGSLAGLTRLAEAGVGAVVLPSLFQEQLPVEDERDWLPADGSAPGGGAAHQHFRNLAGPGGGDWPARYLALIKRARAAIDIPVIASLNADSAGSWSDYASAMQAAGASAIELNIYYLPEDPLISAREAELRYIEILTTVKAAVSIPVAVKLAPYFSSLGETATVLGHAGADGLVLFNRFLQTDIDPETFTVSRGFRLSTPAESALARAWISRLHGLVHCSLAASSGVDSGADVAAYLLAGADVVMTTSALLRHGPQHARVLLDGLQDWMYRKGFGSVTAVRGLLAHAPEGAPTYSRCGYLSAIEQASHAYGSAGSHQAPIE
ncbi:MAG TPA: dihydroorotate dehydrogenase-like protein [Trebonia sp.]|jgi:dihydroorotate dehydrogenase (fumarate)|nr:dihydroorotate dehydrogenase-like protein [Trebonia sp.]